MGRGKRRHAQHSNAPERNETARESPVAIETESAVTMPKPPEPETVRVRGVVAPFEHATDALVRASLALESGERVRRDVLERFRVRTEAGSTVSVHVPFGADVTFVPTQRASGPWRTLAENAFAARFTDAAPGGETAVTLDGFQIAAGDRVEVLGEVTARAFDEDLDGLRAAPVSRVSAIDAKVVVGGENPRKTMDAAIVGLFPALERARPRPPITRGLGHRFGVIVTFIAMVALPIAGMLTNSIAGFIDSLLAAITLLAALIEQVLPPMYPSYAGAASSEKLPVRDLGSLLSLCTGWTCALTLAVIAYADAHDVASCATRGIVCFVGPMVLTMIVLRIVLGRAGRASSSRLLGASPLNRDSRAGTWGRVEGTVLDRTPVKFEGEDVALGREHDVTVVPGSDPNIVKTKVVNRATFFVDAPDMIVEIDPTGAQWATTECSVERTDSGRIERDVVPIGARVVVAGYFAPGENGSAPQLRSRPGKPIMFFATARSGDAVRTLKTFRARHWLTVVLLIACACAVAGIVVAANPLLPPDRASSD